MDVPQRTAVAADGRTGSAHEDHLWKGHNLSILADFVAYLRSGDWQLSSQTVTSARYWVAAVFEVYPWIQMR